MCLLPLARYRRSTGLLEPVASPGQLLGLSESRPNPHTMGP